LVNLFLICMGVWLVSSKSLVDKIRQRIENMRTWVKVNYAKLKIYYAATGFGFPFETFAAGFFLLGILIGLVLLALRLPLIEALLAFVAVITFIVSIPVTFRENRISDLEKNLPDALKHMGLVLKAGGTAENALDEVGNTDAYGPLSIDFKKALLRLRKGETFEDVLMQAAGESGSVLLKRTVSIIVDAKKAGAGLADVLFAIAEDARDIMQIQRERLSRTTMQVIFIVTSSMLIAPFIFGFVLSVINYIAVNLILALPGSKPLNMCELSTLFMLFLVVQSIIATLVLGVVRYGRISKYLLYLPIVILAVLIGFEASKWLSNAIVGGIGLAC